MRHSRLLPDVNAGSMADIAFLLLIFFLLSATIPNDQGINRKLPAPCPEGQNCNTGVKSKNNVLAISLNSKNEVMVGDSLVSLEELKEITKKFLDNNGDGSCQYCNGKGLKTSSDNPKKAIISLSNDNLTSYSKYIQVQDELTKAYFELRSDYCISVLNKPIDQLNKEDLKKVKDAYPFILSEATIR